MLSNAELKRIQNLLSDSKSLHQNGLHSKWVRRGSTLLREVQRLQAELDAQLRALEQHADVEPVATALDTHIM